MTDFLTRLEELDKAATIVLYRDTAYHLQWGLVADFGQVESGQLWVERIGGGDPLLINETAVERAL